jgi:hypothetical protein
MDAKESNTAPILRTSSHNRPRKRLGVYSRNVYNKPFIDG